jgi:Uma2 family endonuclease
VPAATAISVSEYLNTSYRPDCDYIDGELLERNVGEWDHSRLQMLLSGFLLNREKDWNIVVVPEQRVQVKATRFRVPDITVMAGGDPGEQIITKPPFLCVEILSPRDRIAEMQDRINDYLTFGVSYVWMINPRTRQSFVYTPAGVYEAKDGILTTKKPDIRVDLSSLE